MQDQILGEGIYTTTDYAIIERQTVYDDHTQYFCNSAAMNVWDRSGEIQKKTESFTKATQGPKEAFIDFLQRLTSAVNRMIPNSEARQIIIESLPFENASSLCKSLIRPLKERSAPLEEWIHDTIIDSPDHDDT